MVVPKGEGCTGLWIVLCGYYFFYVGFGLLYICFFGLCLGFCSVFAPRKYVLIEGMRIYYIYIYMNVSL